MEIHPAAALFPMLSGKEYESFKADIAERGLLEPIWLCDGKILDGRNRQRACEELDIEPAYREYTGETPVAFVWSLNGTRRHMSKSKLAKVAVNMLSELQAEAKKRQSLSQGRGKKGTPKVEDLNETGEAAAQAAAITGVSRSYVYDAAYVQNTDPELFERIGEPDDDGRELSTAKARKIASGTYREPDPTAKRQPRKKRAADIKRLANEGYRAAQIAEEIGIGVERVRNIARDCDITLPDAVIGKAHNINARRVIEQTVDALEGYALGLQTINGADIEVTADEAEEWRLSIGESLKPINKLRRQLAEISNGKT